MQLVEDVRELFVDGLGHGLDGAPCREGYIADVLAVAVIQARFHERDEVRHVLRGRGEPPPATADEERREAFGRVGGEGRDFLRGEEAEALPGVETSLCAGHGRYRAR